MPINPFDQLHSWWLSQLTWRQLPTLWVLASLGVGVAVANLWWLMAYSRHSLARQITAVVATTAGGSLTWLIHMAWLIGPGYAALLAGAASPRLMGLSQIDWGAGLGWGAGVAVMILAVLLAAGLSYRRSLPAAPPWPSLAAAIAGSALLAFEAGALQFQWAFYRSASIEAAASLDAAAPLAAGTWLAVVIVSLQAALSPWFWRDLRTPGLAERQVLRAALLVASAVVFLVSRNFWLIWLLHASVAVLLQPRVTSQAAWLPSNLLSSSTEQQKSSRQP